MTNVFKLERKKTHNLTIYDYDSKYLVDLKASIQTVAYNDKVLCRFITLQSCSTDIGECHAFLIQRREKEGKKILLLVAKKITQCTLYSVQLFCMIHKHNANPDQTKEIFSYTVPVLRISPSCRYRH
jgi:hypothetical protein